jgi:hypothetical protein
VKPRGKYIRRLRLAGILVLAGLLIEVVTLFWEHHLAFVLFLGLGGLLVLSGIVLYLVAISSRRHGLNAEPDAPAPSGAD